ncbi:reverse transcriptase domain-containing protein [Tanacetum coccineum]
MTTVDQWMSVEEIERVIAERVANAIEAIAIYETKTNMARKSLTRTETTRNAKLAENANNKRKWEGNHNGQCTVKFGNCKKVDHIPKDVVKFQKRVDKKIRTLAERQTENKRKFENTSRNRYGNANVVNNQRVTVTSQKIICYECGNQGHYKRDCPERKNQSHKNQIESTRAHGVVHTLRGGETDQGPNNIKDGIEA